MQDQQLLATLRSRFGGDTDFPWEPEWPSHADQNVASVLIAIAPSPQGLSVLLTRRTDHLYHHPGQISFPGGRVEAEDASAIHAALRESEEEIGLGSSHIEVLGTLPDYATSSGFRITPVVGLTSPDFVPKLDAFEVAELFSVPLHFVLQAGNFQRHRVQRQDAVRHFLAVPYPGRFIWGATAGMLAMFAAFMAEQKTAEQSCPPDARLSGQTDLGATAASRALTGVYSA